MNLNGEIVPLFAMTVGLIIVVTKTLTSAISKHKLEVEKIKADAMVKAEEVRSRNELELEKLMRQDRGNNPESSVEQNDPAQSDEENYKSKSRVRE